MLLVDLSKNDDLNVHLTPSYWLGGECKSESLETRSKRLMHSSKGKKTLTWEYSRDRRKSRQSEEHWYKDVVENPSDDKNSQKIKDFSLYESDSHFFFRPTIRRFCNY